MHSCIRILAKRLVIAGVIVGVIVGATITPKGNCLVLVGYNYPPARFLCVCCNSGSRCAAMSATHVPGRGGSLALGWGKRMPQELPQQLPQQLPATRREHIRKAGGFRPCRSGGEIACPNNYPNNYPPRLRFLAPNARYC